MDLLRSIRDSPVLSARVSDLWLPSDTSHDFLLVRLIPRHLHGPFTIDEQAIIRFRTVWSNNAAKP